jgi:rhamnulokinase
MIAEVKAALGEAGQPVHHEPAALARVILDSLALRYASVLAAIEGLTGTAIPGVHVIGGGCRNAYLNQVTADATGRPVLAGPVEATALGNLLVQSIASGELGSLAEARERLGPALDLRSFEPRPTSDAAHAVRERYLALERAVAG